MISVVIPMYNSKDTIERALDSIKSQTSFHEIGEIIVVNDGSKDNSLEVVKRYSESNKSMPIKIIDKENGGVSTARNAGLKIAQGEYIALLDSDDEWLPKKIEIQMDILRKNKEIDFLGCNRNNERLKILFRKIDKLYKATLNDLLITMFPQTSTAIFKRKIVDNLGFYDENQKYCEDANYWLKICANYNFYVLPITLVITGGGKPSFGFSGLSANLKEMQKGTIKNLRDLREHKYINRFKYSLLYIFYYFKYIRRILITKLR